MVKSLESPSIGSKSGQRDNAVYRSIRLYFERALFPSPAHRAIAWQTVYQP